MSTEQNKFDSQVRQKIQSREIQPSIKSWDRLDAMLTVAEKKNKPKFKWLYIAASFLGFILVTTIFLQQNNVASTPEVEVVSRDNNNPAKPSILSQPTDDLVDESIVISQKTSNKALVESTRNLAPSVEPAQDQLQITHNIPEYQPIDTQEIIANVGSNIPNTAKKNISVDPKALLSQVDGEITNTFRARMLATINKNYNEVKVTLATRNEK